MSQVRAFKFLNAVQFFSLSISFLSIEINSGRVSREGVVPYLLFDLNIFLCPWHTGSLPTLLEEWL